MLLSIVTLSHCLPIKTLGIASFQDHHRLSITHTLSLVPRRGGPLRAWERGYHTLYMKLYNEKLGKDSRAKLMRGFLECCEAEEVGHG